MSLLLTSVFRPFGVDDAFGRKENKLELFHNQVTREQGIFSMRYNHRSFGLYFIAENIQMPSVVLDFPTLKQFRKELKKGYDYVGISFITPNFVKAKKMAEIVREVSPNTKIILGGHGTRIPDIQDKIDCDHVITGEGIKPLRRLFGEPENAPIKHPALSSADHKRILGLPVAMKSAVLIPGVGCPNGCRFCSTSHFFDKTYTPFLETGQQIFDTLVDLSAQMKTDDFFVMDENFLLHKDRAMELLDLMQQNNRFFNFSIFSSAEAITAFGIDNMLRLGVRYVWIGAESRQVLFEKNKGIDTGELVAKMRQNGIIVLASSILFLEHQDKDNIYEDIDFAIGLNPDFTQFMQLGPLPQTKLYQEYEEKGMLRHDIPFEEWHGQHRIWFDHPNFTGEETETILRNAFRKEFEQLGPSILRSGQTLINSLSSPVYQTEDPYLLQRYQQQLAKCKAYYWALTALKWLVPTAHMKQQAAQLLGEYRRQLGRRNPLQVMAAVPLYALATIGRWKMELGYEAHNPRAIKTMFRLEPAMYKEMKGRIQAILRNRKTWAILEDKGGAYELSLHFSGKIRERTVRKLLKRLNERASASLQSIKINITPLATYKEETLEAFIDKLADKSNDIRIYCSEAQQRNKALFNRLMKKHTCSVNTY